MAKVPCHCTSHQCGGKDVDPRTQKAHALRDRTAQANLHADTSKSSQSALAQKAADAAEEAIQNQIQTITQHLASTNLSNSPKAKSSSHISPNLPTYIYQPPEDSPVRVARVQRILERLSEVESSASTLHAEVATKLQHSQTSPFLRSQMFPLANAIEKCCHLESDLNKITCKSPAVTAAKDAVQKQVYIIKRMLHSAKKEWETAQEVDCQAQKSSNEYSNDHHFKPLLSSTDPLIQLSIFMVVACQVISGTSRRGCALLYGMLRYIVQLCLMRENSSLSQRDLKLLSDFPIDPRTADKEFNLDAKATIYAVCPDTNCHASYQPTFNEGSPIPIYPSFCTHRRFGRRCKTPLVRPCIISGSMISVPIKRYVAYDLKDWIGRLLAQPGLEAKMDSAWTNSGNNGEEMYDIFDGDMLRKFKGPNGNLFSKSGEEGHYVFSLSVDFFNPLSNKQAGKKISIGLISLVCLNLPADIRYKTEYIFLAGIIPGPHEPPLDTLNHYIRPVVDSFLELWSPGVWFTRTHCHSNGRLILCAIVCLVCDLIAAKKLAGFGSVVHTHFCHICHCTRNVHGYGHLENHLWRPRTNEETRTSAQAYMGSTTELESEEIFSQTGVRWSELLRLPYFDPTRFVVIDPMHNLFLGVVNKHFQDILGIRLDKDPDLETPSIDLLFSDHWTTMDTADKKSVARLMKILTRPLNQDLETEIGMALWFKKVSNLRHAALDLVCSELAHRGCRPMPADRRKTSRFTRADFARGILEWRKFQVERQSDPYGPVTTLTKCGHVFNKDEVEQIRKDISSTVTPSWFTSVPGNLGSASHGKLKADQWRVLGAVFLPITLIRLWWTADPEDPRSVRCRKILDVTISLLSAVSIATSRKTSRRHVDEYMQHMQSYLSGIKELFPTFKFVPNHHMALHLPDYILLYGPVHSWWAFPFERMIGMLQRILTNYKQGEYEGTIAESFVRSSNLRRILEQTGTPEVIRHCKPIFQKFIQPQTRDTLATDMLSFAIRDLDNIDCDYEKATTSNTKIPPVLMSCILDTFDGDSPTSISVISTLTVKGITYSVASRHMGNSSVLIDSGQRGVMLPVRIEYFVQLSLPESPETLIMFAAARRYMPSKVKTDPFSSFPFLRAQLWSNELDELELYPVDSIASHFAYCPMRWEDRNVIAIVSLCREY